MDTPIEIALVNMPPKPKAKGVESALGAMFIMYAEKPIIYEEENLCGRIQRALEAAENINPTSVRGPFTFAQTP